MTLLQLQANGLSVEARNTNPWSQNRSQFLIHNDQLESSIYVP